MAGDLRLCLAMAFSPGGILLNMKIHPFVIKQLEMMRRGQLIVSGGGVTVRQLPTGQYEVRVTGGDLTQNQNRRPPGEYSDPNPNAPTTPQDPTLPEVPEIPEEEEEDGSGSYGGGGGDDDSGAGGTDNNSGPYDFNQRGWEWYIVNF